MRWDDPLNRWLLSPAFKKRTRQKSAEDDAVVQAALQELADHLDNPAPKKYGYMGASLRWVAGLTLEPADRQRAEEFYRRLVAKGGAGSTYIQEELLNLLGAAADPASIPFWSELLDMQRPRDSFANKRRASALAALACVAIRRQTLAAHEALRAAAHHPHPEVRALAILYWGRVYEETERPLPPDVVTDLMETATHDSVFEPRFQARRALYQANYPAPADHPGGVYAFKVRHRRITGMYRTIELQSEQTLDDLHYAIQHAIHWDADHLYSFYMNGERYDRRYQFSSPHEEGEAPATTEAVVGELGLVPKHRFLYHFDYGDDHEFNVQVIGIRSKAGLGKYPRVVDRQGKAPEQYPRWD